MPVLQGRGLNSAPYYAAFVFDLDGNKIEAVTGVWFVLVVIGRIAK